jgi:hypothetical protein
MPSDGKRVGPWKIGAALFAAWIGCRTAAALPKAQHFTLDAEVTGGLLQDTISVAVQEGDGPWRRVSVNKLPLSIPLRSERYGIAVSCGNGLHGITSYRILQATRAEARSWWVPCSVTPSAARAAIVHGWVYGLGDALAKIFVRGEKTSAEQLWSESRYQVAALPGVHDLVALRFPPGVGNSPLRSWGPVDRIILRRGVQAPGDQKLDLDFGTAGIEPLVLPLEVTGHVAPAVLNTGVKLVTEPGAVVRLCQSKLASTRCPYLPISAQRPSDLYVASAADQTQGDPSVIRLAAEMLRTPRPVRLNLPMVHVRATAVLAKPVSFTLEDAPGALAHDIELMASPVARGGWFSSFVVTVTPGWRRAERTYRFPDLSAVWGEHLRLAGTHLNWSAVAVFGNRDLAAHLGRPNDGLIVRNAGVSGQLRVPGTPTRPAGAEEREIFAIASRMLGFLEAGDCESAWRRRGALQGHRTTLKLETGRALGKGLSWLLGMTARPQHEDCRAIRDALRTLTPPRELGVGPPVSPPR